MIRVKNDKRMQHSAQLLLDGLVKCMNEKHFTEISVSDLQKVSGVSRATFYRLFDNIQDVLEYQCDVLAITIQDAYIKLDPNSRENFILFSLRYWLDNSAFLDAVFSCGRMDILQNALIRHSEHLKEQFPLDDISDIQIDYIIASSMGVLSSILNTWIKNEKKETADDLFEIFHNFSDIIPFLLFDQRKKRKYETFMAFE